MALALADTGHAVCVNDTGVTLCGGDATPEPAEAVAHEIRTAGGDAIASVIDARTPASAAQLLSEVEAWIGRAPTVLVHAAGTLRDAMVQKASDEDWDEVLGSHLGVAIELTRAMAPGLRSAGYGRIVYVGGAAGLVGSVGQGAYNVAKAALLGLTRAMALEMARKDICVNYLAPFAFTRMTESIPPVTDQLRDYLRSAPQARPQDIAPFVAWLCSPDASGVSGQLFGARGAEITIWSQPRPVDRAVRTSGWDIHSISELARPTFEQHLTPLESEFDLFGGPPVVVAERTPC